MNINFGNFMRKYAGNRIAVAVSGGVDSVALLHWMVELGADIVVLHVNHGLRAAADAEMNYVSDLCHKLDIPMHVFYWIGDRPESNLESAARDARYKMMTDFCRENDIKYLATAHQADDQIETFLMNLARGSGVWGLAGMRRETVRDGVHIIRPLLDTARAELIDYCNQNDIKFFTDEMNSDEKYTRVKIRQNRHVLSDALGISDARILLAMDNLSRTRDALDDYINERIGGIYRNGFARFHESFLFDVADEIGLKLLGILIQKIGGDKYPPRLNSLRGALSRLQQDCKFTLGHCTLRRHKNEILVVAEGSNASFIKRK
jgi:tRNA(Ile)-lysidine synthase